MLQKWIFNTLESQNIDPFEAHIVDVTSTPMRDNYATELSPKFLVKWDGLGIYTINQPNSSFQFTFLLETAIITQYKILSRVACSPSGLALEGSIDGVNYITLHLIEEPLCNAKRCETKTTKKYHINYNKPLKYIKMVQYKGECNSQLNYFGLLSIDFYGCFDKQCFFSCHCKESQNIFIILYYVIIFIK